MAIYEVKAKISEMMKPFEDLKKEIENADIEGFIIIKIRKNGEHGHYIDFGKEVSLFEWLGSVELLKDRLLEKLR